MGDLVEEAGIRSTKGGVPVTEYQLSYFEQLSRRTSIPKNIGQRSEILLLYVSGAGKRAIARELGIDVRTVRKWIGRWEVSSVEMSAIEAELDKAEDRQAATRAYEQRLWGILADNPRSGTPGTFSAEDIAQIVALACENLDESDEGVSYRTQAEVATEAMSRDIVPSISQSTVCRLLKNRRSEAA